MQIRNDRILSPWDLERGLSVLIPIALENSPDVLSGEIWQGVTEPAAFERRDHDNRPQVLAIKINLHRKSMKRNSSVKAPLIGQLRNPGRRAQNVITECQGES